MLTFRPSWSSDRQWSGRCVGNWQQRYVMLQCRGRTRYRYFPMLAPWLACAAGRRVVRSKEKAVTGTVSGWRAAGAQSYHWSHKPIIFWQSGDMLGHVRPFSRWHATRTSSVWIGNRPPPRPSCAGKWGPLPDRREITGRGASGTLWSVGRWRLGGRPIWGRSGKWTNGRRTGRELSDRGTQPFGSPHF